MDCRMIALVLALLQIIITATIAPVRAQAPSLNLNLWHPKGQTFVIS